MQQNQNKTTIGKKNGGKRLSKRLVADAVQGLFQAHPNEELSFKQIFKALRLDTHPANMLAIDVREEMAWDDYLSKASENSYRLNLNSIRMQHSYGLRSSVQLSMHTTIQVHHTTIQPYNHTSSPYNLKGAS